MSKTAGLLRWLALLPGSLLGAIVVIFPIHWILLVIEWQTAHSGDDAMVHDANGRAVPFLGIPFEMMERLCDAAIVPATVLLTASWIAPLFKRQAALATAVLMCAGYLWLYKFTGMNVPLSKENNWLMVLLNVVSLVATGLYIWKNDKYQAPPSASGQIEQPAK